MDASTITKIRAFRNGRGLDTGIGLVGGSAGDRGDAYRYDNLCPGDDPADKENTMYLVNTSFAVEPAAHERWLEIVQKHYVPLLEQKGFTIVALSRVISVETVRHFTYSLLVEAPDMPKYKELTEELFAEYTAVADPLFGDSVMWYTSLMKKL